MVLTQMKRDIQGKFTLKNDDYRLVRSLRLTDETWKALGIVAECNGLTRADYLEQIVRDHLLPSITPDENLVIPCITWRKEPHSPRNTPSEELHSQSPSAKLPQLEALEALRDRVLLELRLGKQATGYKLALKALNRFISELTNHT